MDILVPRAAGIDIHKKTAVVCCRLSSADGSIERLTQTFGTMTADLLKLSAWLTSLEITQVVMESTGEFWKPLYNLLEGSFSVLVVNAAHVKHVPGRKTDMRDAEWLAELLAHGLLRASFIPPQVQRDLRDLTRQRTNLVRDRATVVNRLQKVLEWSNIKLASVATDVLGVSARNMLEAIVAGENDGQVLAELAQGRLRSKRALLEEALSGRVRDHHRFLIAQHLEQIDFLDEQLAAFDRAIAAAVGEGGEQAPPNQPSDRVRGTQASDDGAPASEQNLTWAEAQAIWDSLPGIGTRVAQQLVAEIGTDLERFRDAAHLASWAKLCPGNHESAGKRRSAAIGGGNQWLRGSLVQAAHAAVRVKGSALAHFYRRIAARRGAKKAIIAVAHKLLTIGYTLLLKREHYREPDLSERDGQRREQLARHLQRRLAQLGYTTQIELTTAATT
jgi:transposase